MHTQWSRIFLSKIDSFINKLTNSPQYYCQTLTNLLFWGFFFQRPARCLWVLGCTLNATGQLVQAALNATGQLAQITTLLKTTAWIIHDAGHEFSYVLWHFECKGALMQAISSWKLLSFVVICQFMATHHPPVLYTCKCLWCW